MGKYIRKNCSKKNNMSVVKTKRRIWLVIGVLMVIVSSFILSIENDIIGTTNETEGVITEDTDLILSKSDITKKAKFYPYKADGTYMEVMALKANDDTIRTAFNVCQECFTSGRGYYTQEGEELVCQYCGNRFGIDDIEVVRGGCNPIPILKDNKTETEENITISKDFIIQYKDFFSNWEK